MINYRKALNAILIFRINKVHWRCRSKNAGQYRHWRIRRNQYCKQTDVKFTVVTEESTIGAIVTVNALRLESISKGSMFMPLREPRITLSTISLQTALLYNVCINNSKDVRIFIYLYIYIFLILQIIPKSLLQSEQYNIQIYFNKVTPLV